MINVQEAYDALIESGVDMFTGVPDSLLKNFCAYVTDTAPSHKHIIAANEGNAVGIAAGHYLATGKPALVYMQNSGLGNTVNPLLSLADEKVYSIPMVLMIGWRGEPGVHDEPQHVKQGEVTLALLDAMQIPYIVLEDVSQIKQMVALAMERKAPTALVNSKGTFGAYKLKNASHNDNPLSREEALKLVVEHLRRDDIIVSTTGKLSRELFELREARKEGHGHDFLTVGSMGHTASIALGMSIGSDKDIYCIDGDGSFIMHMGGMGIAAKNAGKNFKYILINNGAHESVGGQPTIGFDLDVEAILRASGFRSVYTAQTCDEVEAGVAKLREQEGAALIIYTNQGSREDLGRPTIAPEQNKINMMNEFSK